jgi:trigger factor
MIVRNVEKKEHSTVSFQVELDKDEFEKAVSGAYLKNKKNIMVPGFRKGRMIIEGMYGSNVFYDDAINDSAPAAFSFAVEQEGLRPVGKPNVADSNVGEDKSVVLSFETAVYPDVTLGEYKGLKAEMPDKTVSESDIEAELQNIRSQNSRLVTVERASQDGDTVNIDYLGTIDGVPFEGGAAERYNLVLGSGRFVPGFEPQLVGLSAGEEKDIKILFDDDYAAPLAGKEATFHVKLNEVKIVELPEADDVFAKDVSEFDTMEAYKADIAEKLGTKKETQAKNSFEDALVDRAAANMTADIPSAMIEERMDFIFREYAQYIAAQGMGLDDYLNAVGMDFTTFRESSRPAAEKQVRTELLLSAVADAEKIELSEEEIAAEYARISEQYGIELDKVKGAVVPEEISRDLRNKKAMAIITGAGIPVPPSEKKDAEAAEPEVKE